MPAHDWAGVIPFTGDSVAVDRICYSAAMSGLANEADGLRRWARALGGVACCGLVSGAGLSLSAVFATLVAGRPKIRFDNE